MTTMTGGEEQQQVQQQEDDPILLTKEVAAIVRLPPSTLRYYATQTSDQGPPSFVLGRRRVYRRSAVMEWIAEQERKTSNRPAAS